MYHFLLPLDRKRPALGFEEPSHQRWAAILGFAQSHRRLVRLANHLLKAIYESETAWMRFRFCKKPQVLISITFQVNSIQNVSILNQNIWEQSKLEKKSQTMISPSNVIVRKS